MYKTKKKIHNKKQSGGFYIRMSKKMRDEMAVPSKTFRCTGVDCSLCSLYFLGIDKKTFQKLVDKFILEEKKYGTPMGIPTSFVLRMINEHEDFIVKTQPHRVKNIDSVYDRTYIDDIYPTNYKITDIIFERIYDNIPNGFLKPFFYTFSGGGHILIIGKSKTGKPLLLDTQVNTFFDTKKSIINFFKNERITKIHNYIGGITLRSDKDTRFITPGHIPKPTPGDFIDIVKRASLDTDTTSSHHSPSHYSIPPIKTYKLEDDVKPLKSNVIKKIEKFINHREELVKKIKSVETKIKSMNISSDSIEKLKKIYKLVKKNLKYISDDDFKKLIASYSAELKFLIKTSARYTV